jgi:hypothetical protein
MVFGGLVDLESPGSRGGVVADRAVEFLFFLILSVNFRTRRVPIDGEVGAAPELRASCCAWLSVVG